MKRTNEAVILDLTHDETTSTPTKKTKVWKQGKLSFSPPPQTVKSLEETTAEPSSLISCSTTPQTNHAITSMTSSFIINDKENGVKVKYISNYISKRESKVLFDRLMETCKWRAREVNPFSGKKVASPRRYAMISPSDEWIPELCDLKKRVEEFTGEIFNHALINRYDGGNHTIMWHADKETNFLVGSSVASISLGQARDFQFRPSKRKPGDEIITKNLSDGSLVVMNYQTQFHYEHCIPKRSGIIGTRINITFRNYTHSFSKENYL